MSAQSGSLQCNDHHLVSVLVPCFNHGDYISECLDSVLLDGYENLEIVIIDDGSSDSSYINVLSWMQSKSCRVAGGVILSKQENKGLIKTLNLLLEKANGAYFVLLAGDDRLHVGGIQSRLNFLRDNSDFLAVFGDARGINEKGGLLFDSVIREKFKADTKLLLSRRYSAFELILNWCVPGPVFMADRRIVEVVGLYSEEYRIEDRDYYLRLIAADKIGFINEIVADYRFHNGAMTGTLIRQRGVGAAVAEIDKARMVLFRGTRAVALYLSWRGNAARISRGSFAWRTITVIDVVLAKIAGKLLLYIYRWWVRLDKSRG